MIRDRIIQFCKQSHIGMIGLLFLLLGLAGCQDFTDDTGKTMPEPDLKFADGTLKLPLDEKEYEVDQAVPNLEEVERQIQTLRNYVFRNL